ncbi:MAG: hypothetical protein KGJ11_09885, partial [Candidatus Omnitrophica bacterium]|nr:hypothetical protein [Candidatus Omnitrophota bacterium]
QAAGSFLEDAGAKNMKVGGAYIFPKHANIIVKGQGASAQDVHDLHLKMMEAVRQKFGLQLVREVRFAGKFKTTLPSNPEGFW